MRNMSFAMTTGAILERRKTVTRRFGWWFLKPGDLVQPVDRCMGLKHGEHPVRLGGPIRIVSTRSEWLSCITQEDCIKEGFPLLSPREFIEMLGRHYGCDSKKTCNRIEFEYVIEGEK